MSLTIGVSKDIVLKHIDSIALAVTQAIASLVHSPKCISVMAEMAAIVAGLGEVSFKMEAPPSARHFKGSNPLRFCLITIGNSATEAFNEAHRNMKLVSSHMKGIPQSIVELMNMMADPDMVDFIPDTAKGLNETVAQSVEAAKSVRGKFDIVIEQVNDLEAMCVNSQELAKENSQVIAARKRATELIEKKKEEFYKTKFDSQQKNTELRVAALLKNMEEGNEAEEEGSNHVPSEDGEDLLKSLLRTFSKRLVKLFSTGTFDLTKGKGAKGADFVYCGLMLLSESLAIQAPSLEALNIEAVEIVNTIRASDFKGHDSLAAGVHALHRRITEHNCEYVVGKPASRETPTLNNANDLNATVKTLTKSVQVLVQLREVWRHLVRFFEELEIMLDTNFKTGVTAMVQRVQTCAKIVAGGKPLSASITSLLSTQFSGVWRTVCQVQLMTDCYIEVHGTYLGPRLSDLGCASESTGRYVKLVQNCHEAEEGVRQLILQKSNDAKLLVTNYFAPIAA